MFWSIMTLLLSVLALCGFITADLTSDVLLQHDILEFGMISAFLASICVFIAVDRAGWR